MKRVTLRLIYPSSVASELLDAADAGLKPFRRFNVIAESSCADEKGAFKGVKFSKTLREVVSSAGTIQLDMLPKNPFGDFGKVFGIILTPHRMQKAEGDIIVTLSASARQSGYAILSLDKLRDPRFSNILAPMVKREAARIFLSGGICADGNCLMQDITRFADFVARIVVPNLDFCKDCFHAIEEILLLRKRSQS
jgi:hypothetical protein